MNKTLRIFLCAILATSPILAVNTDKQPKESFIKRHVPLVASGVSATIAGFSFWQMFEHIWAQGIIHAECMKNIDAHYSLMVPGNFSPEQMVAAANLCKATQLADLNKAQLLSGEHTKQLLLCMATCIVTGIAARLLYDSWNTPTTNSTEDQETDNELVEPCYYE